MNISERILRLTEALQRYRGEDSFSAVIEDANYTRYLTGTESSNSTLYVEVAETDLSLTIFTDNRYLEKFKNALGHTNEFKVEVVAVSFGTLPISEKPTYIDTTTMSVARFNSIFPNRFLGSNLHDISKVLQRLRSIKDADEVEKIYKATDIADKSLLALLRKGLVGKTEVEIRRTLDQLLLENGADASSFPTIVAAGPNASMPHATPSDRVVEATDMIIIDFGATFEGYHSDTTRTIKASNRDFTAFEARIVEEVLSAHQCGVASLRVGASGGDIDQCVRDHMNADNRGRFIHGLGHGVGLEIHEYPFLVPNSTDEVSLQNVATIEPGIYYPNLFGVRIEDTYRVTSEGNLRLSSLPLVIA